MHFTPSTSSQSCPQVSNYKRCTSHPSPSYVKHEPLQYVHLSYLHGVYLSENQLPIITIRNYPAFKTFQVFSRSSHRISCLSCRRLHASKASPKSTSRHCRLIKSSTVFCKYNWASRKEPFSSSRIMGNKGGRLIFCNRRRFGLIQHSLFNICMSYNRESQPFCSLGQCKLQSIVQSVLKRARIWNAHNSFNS